MPSESKLYIVGIGPGSRDLLTRRAKAAIADSKSVVGYRPYLDLVSDLLEGKAVSSTGMGREVDRAKEAVGLLDEGSVALVSSGDPNVYGMAGLGLEVASGKVDLGRVEVVPGITSFSAAACRAGITFRKSVAVISLSDLLTPWPEIEKRARIASELNMPIALYNPRSKKRTWQLDRVLDICTEGGRIDRDLLVARNVAREGEDLWWTKAEEMLEKEELRQKVDMFTLLIIGGDGMTGGGRGEEGVVKGESIPKSRINLVGVGPGDPSHLTLEAEEFIERSNLILGPERHLQAVRESIKGETVSNEGGFEERIRARLLAAKEAEGRGETASILFGGDPSTFSSAWRILEPSEFGPSKVHVSPGVGAFSAAAARIGAPLVNDFVLLSGLDDDAPERARKLMEGGFAVVIYNQSSEKLSGLAGRIGDLDPERPFGLVQDATRHDERIAVGRGADLARPKFDGRRCTLIIAGPEARIKDGRIITRRGYQTKYDY
ncbi:MAG TPA: SAM-dependent methyltransferase [Methanothrix sp.]|mgnify:CR=1 FL=1|nr:SAM-dependent methyltransferase [Methanothrix sp.]HPJ83427.1 SAM-dependent methyltransferase [Methanothrix sp.]HPR66902.1 SAM-dependent methyltransferase [Methanothrix sp.]